MAFERTLLERIDAPDDDSRRLQVDSGRLAQSVLRHLERMLNVRQGSVVTLPDYGVPDVNDLATQFPDALTAIRRVIKQSIEQYEPRLSRISVQYVANEDDPLDVRFKIAARLAVDDTDEPITFETGISNSGRLWVRG